ncbi:hypothetical protein AAG570_006717 [Ranatra chinensis]|uniref:Uncharacterized protein n=1 Tax=Ranatra chinensis TaxID=642074 RepID=A0ABD0ZI49_9HEMI
MGVLLHVRMEICGASPIQVGLGVVVDDVEVVVVVVVGLVVGLGRPWLPGLDHSDNDATDGEWLTPRFGYFKTAYAKNAAALKNWRDNSYEVFDLKEVVGTAYFDDGSIMVVMYWYGTVDVFRLSRSGSTRVQSTIPSAVPGGVFTFAGRNDRYVVFRCGGTFLCYEWHSGRLRLAGAVTPEVELFPDGSCDLKTLVESTLVIYVRSHYAIYFWSLEESRYTGFVTEVPNVSLTAYEELLYVPQNHGITAYDVKGRRRSFMSLNPFRKNVRRVDLQMNDRVILAVLNCAQGTSVLKAWDWNFGEIIEFREAVYGVFLHPNLPSVIYVKRNTSSFRIVMRCLLDFSVVWERPFPTSSSGFLFGPMAEEFVFLNSVSDRYLLCAPRNTSNWNDRILLNLKTGKRYHTNSASDEKSIVKYSNDKVIEVEIYGTPYCHGTRVIIFT